MKLVVKNFQSLEDVSLEIGGFTVVTGQTNLGKSALVRAFSAAVFGQPGDFYIRAGKDQCAVGIGFSDLKLKWAKVRGGKTAPGKETSLNLNGVAHTKLGREQSVLTEPFGFREVKTQYSRLRPQVAGQHDPIFLLTEAEATVAEVFKQLGRVDVVTEAQRLAKRDLKDAEALQKVRVEDLETARKEKEELAFVPVFRVKWNEAKEELRVLEEKEKASQGRLEKLARLRVLQGVTVPPLEAFPDDVPMVKLLEKLVRLKLLSPKEVPELGGWEDWGQRDLLSQLEKLKVVNGQGLELTREVAALDQEIKGVLAETFRVEEELGVCPVCGKAFEHESSC